MKRLAILIACLGAGACSHAAPDAAKAYSTREQLLQLVQDKSCTSSQQCRSLPLGAKPCGGPEGYLAWSTAHADAAAVAQMAERYRQERKAEHERRGVASDCRFLPDPGAVCRAGQCQAGANAAE